MKLLAIQLAAELVREWESFREYAYPDPASPLARATRGMPWGFQSAVDIFHRLTPREQQLSGEPWTIGYGTTGRGIILPTTRWSKDVAEAHLAVKLEEFQAGVRRLTKGVALEPWEEAALISFAFNVGLDEDDDFIAEGLGDSTLLRLVLAGDKRAAARQFERWNKAQGFVLQGLVKRREAERLMFVGQHPYIARLREV